MKSSFLSASEMEQIVSLYCICFDTENSAFGEESPVPLYSDRPELDFEVEDVDKFVRFQLISTDRDRYLSCYEVWEKGSKPFEKSRLDRPMIFEYQGKDYYVRPCKIIVYKKTTDSLEQMRRLLINQLWENNAFLRILLDQDISHLHEECKDNPLHLQQAYEEAKNRYQPSRRFFSSEEL